MIIIALISLWTIADVSGFAAWLTMMVADLVSPWTTVPLALSHLVTAM
jgi:hypothetical protein